MSATPDLSSPITARRRDRRSRAARHRPDRADRRQRARAVRRSAPRHSTSSTRIRRAAAASGAPDQSPLLWMNSMAEDVTMFTDETVDRTVRSARAHARRVGRRRRRDRRRARPPAEALAALAPRDFAGRRLQGAYLRWVHERAVAALPPGVTVHDTGGRARTGRRTARRTPAGVAGRASRTAPRRPRRPRPRPPRRRTRRPSSASWPRSRAARSASICRRTFTADSDLSRTAARRARPRPRLRARLRRPDGAAHRGPRRTVRARRRAAGLPALRARARPVRRLAARSARTTPRSATSWTGERPPLPRFFGPAQVDGAARPAPTASTSGATSGP